MHKSEKGDNTAKYSQKFTKKSSDHLHLRHNPRVKYHVPSSSGSLDTLLTRCFMG